MFSELSHAEQWNAKNAFRSVVAIHRSTSLAEFVSPVSDLPSFWTLVPGALSGMLFIGRVARWLQFVLGTMGKPTGSFSVNTDPRPWKTFAAAVLYPTPWIALGLSVWAIHHIFVAPFTNEWRWFYVGFFGGPAIAGYFIYRKITQLRAKKAVLQQ